jgi:phospholipid/cholesterol/gamma-HCH transport system substrate-binding protein
MNIRHGRVALMLVLTLVLGAAVVVVARTQSGAARTHMVAYFDNSNGIFPGDDVYILGVQVGEIETIEPQPERAKIEFWISDEYQVPADVRAVILSPQLITSRAVQLTPAYTGGPALADGAVIPEDRTEVPVEWDDFREQLQKLSDSLQPTTPGGVSPFGAFVDTVADNLRGQGANIRDTIIKLSQAFSVLGDHSGDIFGTVKNLSILVSALKSSTDLMRELNRNVASASALLANDADEIGQAVNTISTAAGDVQQFVAENKESIGTASDKLASITSLLAGNLDVIKQALHIGPTAFAGLNSIFEPAHGSLTGALALNNFSNPVGFICNAIQAASRMGAERSAKLCVQYLAPILKNRQFNFPPLGLNPIVNAQVRPNEITYSEDWLRPDYRPTPPVEAAPVPAGAAAPPESTGVPPTGPPLPAEAAVVTNPDAGLPGLMVPAGAGS